jgi:hypothetical protein
MAKQLEGHWPLFSRPFIRQSFHYIADLDLVYFNNAKCACSTVKSALLKYLMKAKGLAVDRPLTVTEVHGANPLWSDDLSLISKHKTRSFTIVRNPYTRVLSAYLDKIARPGILRNQFFMQHKINIKSELSFKDFLMLINQSRQERILDQHYRTQCENIFYDIDIGHIIYLENFGETYSDLNAYLELDLEYGARQGHETKSATKLTHYIDSECADLVREIYAIDFDFLGYSTDLNDASAAPGKYGQHSAKIGGGYKILSHWRHESNGDIPNLFGRRRYARGYAEFLELSSIAIAKGNMRPSQSLTLLPHLLDAFLSGRPIEKYIAADAMTSIFGRRFTVETVEMMATKMIDLAPYFHAPRIRMIRSAIRQSKSDKAKALIEDLSRVTFDQVLVEELKRKLEAVSN